MPLLLYCVAPSTAEDTAVSGVGGAAVRSKVEAGLKFFYSETESASMTSHDVVAAAQAVHAVVSDVFSRAPVLPFQYPTVLADEHEIAKLAEDRGVAFREFLKLVGSKVQMDVRLTITDDVASGRGNPHPPAREGGRVGQPTTGTAYLQARAERQASLSAAAETCRLAAHPADWRVLPKNENIRCQALIERVEVLSFLERMRTLELPAGVRAAISGPWPPAAFWDEPR